MYEQLKPVYRDDEIDLFELIETLWKGKFWIVLFICLAAIGGSGYAFLATPTYQAEVKLLPPSYRDVAELNKLSGVPYGENVNDNENENVNAGWFTALVVYERFSQTLESASLRKAFYAEPDVADFYNSDSLPLARIWKSYNGSIVIINPDKNTIHTHLRVSVSEAGRAADFANRYVALALQITKTLLISDFNERLSQLKDRIIAKLNSRRETYVSQIKMELADQLAYLNTISLNTEKIRPAIIDMEAIVPPFPVKPKKVLILALSIILGGIVGVTFVLVRSAIRNRQKAL